MKRSFDKKKKSSGIKDPAHPFHLFAKKEAPLRKVHDKNDPENSLRHKSNRYKDSKGKLFNDIRGKRSRDDDRPVNNLHYTEKLSSGSDLFPLNKFVAHTGLCARRKAVEYIKAGEISVNGKIITEPGFKVTSKDEVFLKGKKLFLQREPVYILLNKPKGYITTTRDPKERKTVMELIAHATSERVFPIGRLDRNTSGLLILTNDGDLAQILSHPSHEIRKVYHVSLDKPLTKHDFERVMSGVSLDDGPAIADVLAYEDEHDKTQIGIEIHNGRNRIVRRIFEQLGYEVKALDRVLYAGLTKKNIPRGKWRMLSPKEVVLLKHFQPKKARTI